MIGTEKLQKSNSKFSIVILYFDMTWLLINRIPLKTEKYNVFPFALFNLANIIVAWISDSTLTTKPGICFLNSYNKFLRVVVFVDLWSHKEVDEA